MPLLSTSSTLFASTGFTTAYLASIYLLPSTRVAHSSHPKKHDDAPPPEQDIASSVPAQRDPPRDRNHPAVIKARLLAVSLASTASCAAFPLLLSSSTLSPSLSSSYRAALPLSLKLLGLALPSSPLDAARLALYPLGLTASLFAGTWYVQYLAQELPWQAQWTHAHGGWWAAVKSKFDGWRGVRNYVVAPLTEEVTFRSCIVAASHLGGFSKSSLVFLTPLWFGLAHVHHAWETYLAGGRTRQALIQGVLQSTFQFAYTTLFGWYASFLFLRTGSLLPPFLAHALCNMLGLPSLGWALHYFPEKKISIYASYLAGIATFSYGLFRWTDPALFGGSLFWA
ncbi:hypothetical protein JCM6882_005788 [Rhodosporidiobolus microsporus]